MSFGCGWFRYRLRGRCSRGVGPGPNLCAPLVATTRKGASRIDTGISTTIHLEVIFQSVRFDRLYVHY